MDADEAIGKTVKALREELGLSQAQVAQALQDAGVRAFYPQTVLKVEKGTRSLKLAEGIALARVLAVKPEDLYRSPDAGQAASRRLALALREVERAYARASDELLLLDAAWERLSNLVDPSALSREDLEAVQRALRLHSRDRLLGEDGDRETAARERERELLRRYERELGGSDQGVGLTGATTKKLAPRSDAEDRDDG